MTKRSVLILAVLSLAVDAQADVRWNLTTADLKTQPINLVSIDESSIHFVDKQSADQTLPLDQVVGLTEEAPPAPATPPKFILRLSNGAMMGGDTPALKDEKISITNPLVGEQSFALKQVSRLEVVAHAANIKNTPPSKTDDLIQLANGDSVHGFVEAITAKAVTIKTDAGENDVPIDSIAAVVFADAGGKPAAAPKAGKGFRLTLADGSSITARKFTFAAGTVFYTVTADQKNPFTSDLDKFIAIEPLDGPVAWLSSITPTENVQTPFLETSWPARMNTTLTGEPIRFGTTTYTHGIGVHSRSHLSWTLDGTYKTFRTEYAIDGNAPYADVEVKIFIDGQPVHDLKNFKAGAHSGLNEYDISTAKTLSLDVDFGAGYDVQDRLNWIEPALLKAPITVPTTPATQP